MPLNIFFSAAEVSGDILAGALAREPKTLDPHISMFGFGGSKLSEAGVALLGDLTATSAIGVLDPVVRLPRYVRTLSATKRPLSDEAARQRVREGYRRARAALAVPGVTRALAADVCASIASLAHSPAGTARR